MNQERIKLLEELYEAATQLVSYTSYAEIVGAISHNRSAIRKYCDEVQEINAKIKHMDENKRFRIKLDCVLPNIEQARGQEYQFTLGWVEDEGIYKGQVIWLVNDDNYPDTAPRSIAIQDLEVIDG